MTIESALKIIQDERKRVEAEIAENSICNSDFYERNCARYDLELPANEILEAYDLTISVLEYVVKHQSMIGGKL